jgi:predicted permease
MIENASALLVLSAPFFFLVFAGFGVAKVVPGGRVAGDWLGKLAFSTVIPVLLFRLMANVPNLPPVDPRMPIAFFSACVAVFFFGRFVASRLFALPAAEQSIFGVASVFSNIVMLGVPLAHRLLGDAAVPAVSTLIVFNAIVLWTLVTVSIEWVRSGKPGFGHLGTMALRLLANPIIAGIALGIAFGYSGLALPGWLDRATEWIAAAAAPIALLSLGAGLAAYPVREGISQSAAICALKLLLQPAFVWALARLIGLPEIETRVAVLIAALPVGANVYLMSRQFEALGGAVASSLVISTAISALTVPMALAALL